MKEIVPIFSIVMALGIIIIWVKEIRVPHLKQTLLQWREGEHLVWPHVSVELITALLLLLSGIGSLLHIGFASIINYFSLGALFYASFNSLSWTLANKGRGAYTFYMLAGVIGSISLIAITVYQIIN